MGCDHGIVFDMKEAKKLLVGWVPRTAVDFIVGNPASSEIKQRWPRLDGLCPLGCGYCGIAYASWDHFYMEDW